MRKNLFLSFLFVVPFLLTSCGGSTTSEKGTSEDSSSQLTTSQPATNSSTTSIETVRTISISNLETSLLVGSDLQLHYAADPETNNVTWSTSAEEIASISETGLVKAKKIGKVTLTVALKDYPTIIDSITLDIAGNVNITNEETSLFINDELQLKYESIPANAEVIWSSSSPEIASISETGLVKGLTKGSTTFTVTLKDYPAYTDSVMFNIIGSLSFTSVDSTIFVNKELQMEYVSDPLEEEVTFSSTDETVATISATGLVKGLKAGETTIKVSLKNHTSFFDEVKVTVKDTIIDASINADAWDFTGLYSDNPTFTSAPSIGNQLNSYAVLNNVKGQNYVFSAQIKIASPKGDDTWSRVSLGNLSATNSFHGMFLSPGADFNARKTVVMDIENGGVQWGLVTDRSQVWGQHDLSKFDFSKPIEFKTVRNNDNYYYFLNNELYWMESLWAGLSGQDSTPTIMAAGCEISVSEIKCSTLQATVDEVLATPMAKEKFYPSYKDNVVINNEEKTIKFINAENGITTNIKDNAAKSIGDAVHLEANRAATVSFDLVIDLIGGVDAMPVFGLTMQRHDNNVAEARSFLVGETNFGFSGWNTNSNLPDGIGANNVLSRAIVEGELLHVTCDRLMSETSQDCSMTIVDDEKNVLGNATWGWTNEGNSTGNVVLSLGTRNMNATISNFVISYK